MFPTPNNANALYNIGLKIRYGIYFSVNANIIIAAKPIATKVKHNFFCLFILSIDFMVSLYADLTLRLSCGSLYTTAGQTLSDIALIIRPLRSSCFDIHHNPAQDDRNRYPSRGRRS